MLIGVGRDLLHEGVQPLFEGDGSWRFQVIVISTDFHQMTGVRACCLICSGVLETDQLVFFAVDDHDRSANAFEVATGVELHFGKAFYREPREEFFGQIRQTREGGMEDQSCHLLVRGNLGGNPATE